MTCRCVGACLVLLLLAADPSAVTAQAPEDCTYASCALRIRHRVFSTYLVQEQSEHRVASLGLFPAAVPLFAGRLDSAARYYAGFRRRQTSGVLLGLAGSVVLATGLLASDGDVGWAWTLAGSP